MSLSVLVYTMIGRERRQSNMYGRLQGSSGYAKTFHPVRAFYAVISHRDLQRSLHNSRNIRVPDLFAYYKLFGVILPSE